MSTLEELREKSINFWFRFILRVMGWVTLMFYMIFRIIIPVTQNERVEIDKTDGYIMIFCITLLIAIEIVKAFLVRFANKKSS